MNIICSSAGIVNPFRPGQGIMDIVNAGFQNLSLELDMCCSSYELEYFGNTPKGEESAVDRQFPPISEYPSEISPFFDKMLTVCKQNHVQITIARAPYLLRDSKRRDLRERMYRIYEECIRVCGQTGCHYLVIRPLYSDRESEDAWRINREFYFRLAMVAQEYEVMILLENQCRNMNGHMMRSTCSDGEMAAKWVDKLNKEVKEERFGFCMDVGVCSLCGQNMHEFSSALGKRIKAVILRDCDGQREAAMLPFTCAYMGQPQTDWLNLIRGLREICFDGQLILDFRDTVCTFSPLLRPQLMALAKSVADYFKWQVGLENLLKKYPTIVLFGAGNMCRNYMKCYGEKYAPLFTCDNNQALWGTMFCGLEVKPPESLKELPEDCVIFICNIYYREIEWQLRSMGIRNPIEFFNDEYMPAFYFDRIERE